MTKLWSLSQKETSAYLEYPLQDIIPPSVFEILRQRGFSGLGEMIDYLRPSLFNFHSPFLFKDMQAAVFRLEKALACQEKVLVYGDYDADGVTGTALLYKALRRFGFNVLVHIPTREEGYGLHQEIIFKAAKQQISLIITVDCGITAVEETRLATLQQIDVIVTDHHEPPELLPSAVAILNPKVLGSGYPFPNLAGVGVAFKLVQALFQHFRLPYEQAGSELDYLDLAALGTIADIVPLVGENRLIVKYGLETMETTRHMGMKAILEECGLGGKKLKAGQISFIVAPRINAAGRMDTARLALNLFLEEDYDAAREIARDLGKENHQRQQIEREISQEAEQTLALEPLPEVIVLSSPHWHHGVIGIVASRLAERFHRPVFLIAEEGDIGKGSARGIPGYHVLEELTKQAVFLDKYGGHKQAAGFTLGIKNIPSLREGLIESFRESDLKFQEEFFIDALVPIGDLDLNLQKDLEQMAPFGAGNPAPILMTANLAVKRILTIGKQGEHLKLILESESHQLEGLAFKKGHELERLKNVPKIDIIYYLECNEYQGEEKVQAVLKDYRSAAEDLTVAEENLREAACTLERNASNPGGGVTLPDIEGSPSDRERPGLRREILVEFYKELKSLASEQEVFTWQSGSDSQLLMLKIFEELRLLRWLGGTGPFLISLCPDIRTELHLSLRFRNAGKKT